MKKTLVILLVTFVGLPLLLAGAAILFSGPLFTAMLEPDHRQHEDPATSPPDYADDAYWASLPGNGPANLVPEGQEPRVGDAGVAVFYLHPTSYLSGATWNAPLFADSWSWEMVSRMMAGQASAFNACCDVYAPHYREATFWSFLDRSNDDGLRALEVAYEDVASAFDEFLDRFAAGRPFIIAGHSQGSAHAARLLAEKVNDSDLRARLVAAYLVGYYLPVDQFERGLTNIPPCDSATDTGCVIHWATFGEGGRPEPTVPHWYASGWEYADDKPLLCTNPLSWRRDGPRVAATGHVGALPLPVNFGLHNLYFNRPTGDGIAGLPAVLPGITWAECRNGVLYVEVQTEGPFASGADSEKRDYHTRDYALFYQDIRDNAVERSQAALLR